MLFLVRILILCICWDILQFARIDLAECEPPDFPRWGGYGPRQAFYLAGDFIHYYCDTDTYIGGNYYRRCEDSGDWTGDAPVCDSPVLFTSVNQTSTAEPEDENEAEMARDGLRTSCTRTLAGSGQYWMAVLGTPGMLFRVSLFIPKGHAAYEVMMIKRNGAEYSCGSRTTRIDYLNWEFHNCPEPNNTDVVGIKIKSLSEDPLQICEVTANTITTPSCVDPHFPIQNGRLQITRKTATLVCDASYSKSPDNRLECIRDGVWTRKNLYCLEAQWEVSPNRKVVADP